MAADVIMYRDNVPRPGPRAVLTGPDFADILVNL